MIHNVDEKIMKHRNQRRTYEGFHTYSEYARYFKCPKCQNIVCNSIEEIPDYIFNNLKEFMDTISFLFKESAEPFECPVCKFTIDDKSLIFAHFYIPLYPYNKDLVIEMVNDENNSIHESFIIIEDNGNKLEINNINNINNDILHPSKNAFQKGIQSLKNNEIKIALKMFKKALHYYKSWERALIEIARCYLLLGSIIKGEKILKRVLKLNPRNINALLLKCWYYYMQDDLVKSEKICRKVLSINSNIADAYYYLALIELDKGEIENTINNLEEVLKIDPDHIDASKLLYLIAEAKRKKKNEK